MAYEEFTQSALVTRYNDVYLVGGADYLSAIAEFLREWKIKEISFAGVTVEHLITGEVETYAVDYTPEKKASASPQFQAAEEFQNESAFHSEHNS